MSELLVSALRSRSSAERRTTAAVGAAAVPVGCFAIVAALAATNGNKAQAAAILEIDRSTLYKKLKEYGIDA